MTHSASDGTVRRPSTHRLWLGTAGWSVPSSCRDEIGGEGSHLARYSRVLRATEIDTSFYRPHRKVTYERWARTTPDDFRFAVKVPKTISHVTEPQPANVEDFMAGAAGLGDKLAVLLVQFPPNKAYVESEAHVLFETLRAYTPVRQVWEPRHPSWFTDEVNQWLCKRQISRVAADPPRAENADQPGGWQGLRYIRLHGAPRIYYSSYDDSFLRSLDAQLTTMLASSDVWCVFDNTAVGAAMENALALRSMRISEGVELQERNAARCLSSLRK